MLPWLRHIVVFTQENHSFDNLFGRLPCADGIPEGVCLPDARGRCVPLHPVRGCSGACGFGPPHSWDAIHRDWNAGRMDGFVRTGGPDTMGYFREQQVALYIRWAAKGLLLDRYFCSVLGPTFPNRLYLIAGESAGLSDDPQLCHPPKIRVETVFDQLSAKRIPWRFYVGGYSHLPGATLFARALQFCPLLWIPRFLHDPYLRSRIVPLGAFFSDVQSGRLPPVSFLSPNFFESGHPPSCIGWAMHAFDRIATAIRDSPLWDRTLLILNFDEGGGFFDHVTPPVLDSYGPGMRVPCVLLSGRLVPGVEHGIYDHTSVLRLIEEQFELPLLGARTRDMPSVATALAD